MSSLGYAYVGHVQLPWVRGVENEGHGPDYLKWPKIRLADLRLRQCVIRRGQPL